jgi:hypothetical protein
MSPKRFNASSLGVSMTFSFIVITPLKRFARSVKPLARSENANWVGFAQEKRPWQAIGVMGSYNPQINKP